MWLLGKTLSQSDYWYARGLVNVIPCLEYTKVNLICICYSAANDPLSIKVKACCTTNGYYTDATVITAVRI